MNEQQLHDRLAALVDDQPPLRQGSHDDLRAGRTRLRRRQGTVLAGATGLAVAAVVLAAQAPWVHGGTVGRTSSVPVASGAADPTSGVVERCTRTDNGALDPTTFGPGSRVLTMETDAGGDVNAVVLASVPFSYARTTRVCATMSPNRCRLLEVSVTTSATV